MAYNIIATIVYFCTINQSGAANMPKKLKILFVCTINRMRSATAHSIYSKDERFLVLSAGTDSSANIVLNEEHINWADAVIVMEKHHRDFIQANFKNFHKIKKIVCLYIADDYEYLQPELVDILQHKFENVYRRGLLG